MRIFYKPDLKKKVLEGRVYSQVSAQDQTSQPVNLSKIHFQMTIKVPQNLIPCI